jgi:hypothetical protein
MREEGEVRFRFFGDRLEAQQLISEARQQLGNLKRDMVLNDLQQHQRTMKLPTGAIIQCISSFGQDTVLITTPSATAPTSALEATVSAEPEPETLYMFSMPMTTRIGFPPNLFWVGQNSTIGGKTVGFGIKGDNVIVLADQVPEKVWLLAAKRCIQRGTDLQMAREIINSLDSASSAAGAGPTMVDGAFFDTAGFSIDPAIFSTKSYFALMTTIIPPQYFSAFAHLGTSQAVETYPYPDEYNRLYHGSSPARYFDRFYTVDGAGNQTTLWNTALVGAGTGPSMQSSSTLNNPSISPEYPGFDSLAIGTTIWHDVMARQQSFGSAVEFDGAYAETFYVRRQILVRSSFIVTFNDGVTCVGSKVNQAGGTANEGPTSGEVTAEVKRYRYRRDRNAGWQTIGVDTLAPDNLGGVKVWDFNSPPNVISSAADFTLIGKAEIDLALVPYSSVTYTNADLRTVTQAPLAFNITAPVGPLAAGAPTETTNGINLTLPQLYPTTRIPTRTADPFIWRYTSPAAIKFNLSQGLTETRVVAADTTQIMDVQSLTPPALNASDDAPLKAQTMEWSATVQATIADFRNNGRLTARMNTYVPNVILRSAMAPPASPSVSFSYCIYHAALKKFLFFTLKTKTAGANTTFRNTTRNYRTALVTNPSGASALFQSALSQIDIQHNDGLSLLYIMLAPAGNTGIEGCGVIL